jgi:chemosensory pili system protein ChpA (sensor histidine kinase/response regulator)
MQLAGPLAEHLRRHYEAGSGLTRAGLTVLRGAAVEIEKMAASLAAKEEYRLPADLLRSLGALGAAPKVVEPSAEPEAAASRAAREAAPFDREIAGIFAEEAAEILDKAELALRQVRQSEDQSAFVELQRLLHTLKGGARMAGIIAMGDLSHALETVVTAMASGRADGAAIDLAQRCLDQLHHMRERIETGSVASAAELIAALESFAAGAAAAPLPAPVAVPEPPPRAAAVIDIDDTGNLQFTEAELADLASIDIASAGAQPSETVSGATDEPTIEEPFVMEEPTVVEDEDDKTNIAPVVASAAARAVEPAAEPAPQPVPQVAIAAAPADLRSAERAEMARVDAGLLDGLLNGAGEINIFQSRLNQQLRSIEFHLGELGQTVSRLRDQLRKLEAETEAQILHRHQDDVTSDRDFDPLELDRYSTIQQLSRALAESANDVASINELLHGLTTETETLLTQQARVTAELQDGLMQTRMVPFQRHVARLQRIVRQACADTRKSAELVVEGENSELDRQVLETMLPPFEHLLRNAVVHGIEDSASRTKKGKPETGQVRLKLKREGAEVLIEVSDDGAGLNLQAIRRKAYEQGLIPEKRQISDEQAIELILQPGFSTAGELTQTAGRGVGMDVVDNEVKKLGGSMRIETTAGQGTRFVIRLPYTLAITHALIVNVGDETFALPLPTVEGITRVSREKILKHLTEDEPKLDYGGVSYRIQHLGSLVGAAPSALPEEENAVSLVLVRAGESSTALLTDSLEGSREIVVKTLGPHIASVPGVTGATILGDGRVIMILDAGTLVRAHKGVEVAAPVPPPVVSQTTALVVDDSITMRRVTQRLLERRGARVLTARDGLDAITVMQEHEVDIILLDIEMPRMDGYQFATHVRNDPKAKHVPIIMITSRSGEKHRAKAIEIGVNDYLSKPYQESQLVAAIEGLLGRELR